MTTTQPQKPLGLWDNIETEEFKELPKISFEVNVPQVMKFINNKPKENLGDDGLYCIFHVKQGGEEKVLMTSAITLLRELKKLSPLQDKYIQIEKKTFKGKNFFVAKEAKDGEVVKDIPKESPKKDWLEASIEEVGNLVP